MTDTWTWATVTQATPLRIKVDGDTTALDATTDNLVGSLAVDDRVRVHLHSDGIIVTGLQGGYPTPLVFAWLGTPNASESVLRTVDGTEVRRNLWPYPQLASASQATITDATKTIETGDGPTATLDSYWRGTKTAVGANGVDTLVNATTITTGVYTLSCWIRSSKEQDIYILPIAGGSGGHVKIATGQTRILANVWTRVWVTSEYVVTGAVAARIRTTGADYSQPIGGTFDVTGFMFEKSSTLGEYFDGSQYPAQDKQATTVEYVASEYANISAMPYAEQAGTIAITGNGTTASEATLGFKNGLFSVAPIVICGTSPEHDSIAFVGSAISITATGCSIRLYRADGGVYSGTYAVPWRAVQMASSSGAGFVGG